MMKYDFTSIIDRHGKDSTATDAIGQAKHWGNEPDAPREGFDFLPMWVADMSFATAPAITKALSERLQHPLFGYFPYTDEYYQSIINWHKKMHGVDIGKEYIGYENGVHGAITSSVQVLSQPGDKILIHSPLYVGFLSDVEGTGRKTVTSPLLKDEQGVWRMDYDDMDRKLRENHIHLAIFCSPHNPCGRVWESWEIKKAMEVYEANNCYVISDEIWSDLTYSGHQHIPSYSVSDWARSHTVSAYATSKTFNLAGLVAAYHVIPDPYLRDRITGYGQFTHYNEMNVLSMHALIGAYSDEGHEWVMELRRVLESNCRYAVSFIKDNFAGVDVSMPEGTYMLFLDLSSYCRRTGRTRDEVLKAGWDVGVGWQNGQMFGGPCHIRMNVALPYSRVQEAMDRLHKYVFNT